jgi:hypothetical protein
MGVIVYVSLSGTFPFEEDRDIYEQIMDSNFLFPKETWKNLTVGKLFKKVFHIMNRKKLTNIKQEHLNKGVKAVFFSIYLTSLYQFFFNFKL